ncbi:PAS domain-containing protein [Microcoleus sp. Pol14C6]|uniref:PAS domain-containing protein n=1 Tax=unclassified Microcoleus TaxID=2642155 RepID=UPI002FD6EB10
MIRQSQLVEQIFAGNSEMAMLMRSHDWSLSALGAVETWSQSLKTAIRIILGSRYPMFVWWGQQMTKFYNDAYIPVLGKRHPQALGQPASRVWAEIWDTLGPQAEAVLNQGQSTWNQELLLVMERNGYTEETYFTFSYSPVANDDGPVGGVFCACSEDTQRVLSDRRLATLRELAAETVTAKTQEAACEISATVLTNNAYDIPFALFYLLDGESEIARLAGTTRLAAGTLGSCETIELTSAQKCQWELKQVIETGESRIIEDLEAQFGLLPGGAWSQSPHQAVVLPLARSGETFGFLIAGVSPLRTFDDDYKGFFDLMAGQVTTAIANAQAYEEERKRAEALAELDRAKTTFFSNVSHEFRTPLTLMLAPLEDTIANLNGTIPPQEREQLQLVQRNGMRLLKLVNSLLDFSRIEAGRVQAAYEPVDLATYTAELASTFRSLIERVGMSLSVDCPTLPEAIYVDREMWEKIVLNLLSNAFKFTLAGTISVRLQWAENCVELLVADTGVGIPSEELPHLFERFHRIKNSQGRSFEGSGIGLSLVQELVKLHGGAIDVSSTFGQGSCFRVTIPTGTAHLPQERIGASRTLASTALGAMPYVEEAQRWLPESDFRLPILDFELDNNPTKLNLAPGNQAAQSKILLADDNADMRDYIRRLLSGSYVVQTVADGVAALTALKKNPPDLVLTDVMMPGMDGFELLRSLRSNPATQDIPIILLSARAGEESRIEGLAAGADDYLIKPFSARELLARVEASLKLARLRQEATVRERTLLGRVTDGFMAMDLDFRITYANEAAQEVSRIPLEAILGKTMWEAFPGTIGNQFEFQYRRASSEQVAVDFEEYYAPLDLWVEVHVYPSPTGLSIFFRDINERKKIEQERERFLAVGSDLQVIAGINGYFHWVSPTFERILGWTPDEMTSRPWTEFVHPDDLGTSLAEADSLFSGNETFTFENRYRHKDGSYRWFLWNAQPYPEEQVIYGAAVDITDRVRVENERKRAEAALRETEEQSRNILESIAEAFFALDETWRFTYVNQFAEKLLDRIPGDLIGKNVWEEYPGLIGNELEPIYRIAMRDRLPGSLTAFYPDHDRWYEVRTYPAAHGITVYFKNVTDRIQAETALRQTSAELERQLRKFDALVASVPDFIYTFDLSGRFTYISPAFLNLLEKTSAQALGKNFFDLDYPTDLATRLQNQIQQVIETRQPLKDETPYTIAFGRRAYEYIFVPLFDVNGAVEAVAGVTRDITERKQAEAHLRETHVQLESALAAGAIYTWQWKIPENLIIVNAAFAHLFGVDPAVAAIGLPIEQFVQAMHEEDRPRVVAAINQAIETGEEYATEYRVYTAAGEERWLAARGQVEYAADGSPIAFPGALADITDRKQTVEALRESEELKQRILDSSNDCIKVLTLDSEIVYINTGGLCLLELDDPTLILNTSWLDLWQGEHYENALTALTNAKAGNTGQFQGFVPTRKGSLKWWDCVITPLRNTYGQVTQLVAISRDITKQKQAETQREQLLAQEQTAREAAETANRIKDEFLAVLSHELRSPLNPILGWSKLLQQNKLAAAKTASALASIERNAQLQLQLIDDLLDISRIMSGKLSLNAMSVDLNMVISAALETVRLAAEAKSLQIQTTFSPSLGMVRGDSGRLQQVIWNLLSNAVKFTPQDGQITVRLTQTGSYAQILVTDTGKGINPEFLPYVFEHFRQEDGAITRKFGGLGLGLAIARQIVELHGGRIWVESRGEGQGTTFTVELPLLHTANPVEEVAAGAEARSDELHLANLRVLVVDDERDSREFVAFVAEQAGAKVTAVGSAIEALQLLSTTPFDILLCDIGMPEMDGYMLVRQVRTLPPEQGGQIPAIALTAYAGDFNQKQALAAGFQHHVAKPVEANELVKAMLKLPLRLHR